MTEQSWSSLTSSGRGTQRFLLLLLALGVAVPAIVVAIGVKRVMRPVEELKTAAKEVARGNFGQTIAVNSGDEIEELATEFNLMAEQLRGSYEQLEQRVAERTEELSASELRYRILFEQSRDAIFIRSTEGKIIDINQAALDLFGLDRAEAIGLDVGQFYVDRDDQRIFEQELEKLGLVRDFEEKLRTRDGTEMTCLVTSNLLRAADGAVVGYQGIVRDITERKKSEQELRESQEAERELAEVTASRENTIL